MKELSKQIKERAFNSGGKIYYAKDGWLVSEDCDGNIERIEPVNDIKIKLDKLEYKI